MHNTSINTRSRKSGARNLVISFSCTESENQIGKMCILNLKSGLNGRKGTKTHMQNLPKFRGASRIVGTLPLLSVPTIQVKISKFPI
jgi:hypothetical protein